MKKISSSLTILAICFYVATAVCLIWAKIEFLIYLFKDKPFNWLSVWLAVMFAALSLICIFISANLQVKQNKPVKKSRVEERIEAMRKERIKS